MKAYYINLDSASERRTHVEAIFSGSGPGAMQLARVSAVDARAVRERATPGTLRDTEKACVLSHLKAIEVAMGDAGPALILEDDVSIGPRGLDVLRDDGFFARIRADLVFVSALIAHTEFFVSQYFIYRSFLLDPGIARLKALDMRRMNFAGSDAYIVRDASKRKVVDLLRGVRSLDVPYDLLLKGWIQQGLLDAVLIFPFLTSLSPFADKSLVGNPNDNWNALRRLFCVDSAIFPAGRGQDDAAVETFTEEFLERIKVYLLQYHRYE